MTADPPPTRAEIEGDIEFYLGHGDEGVRDLAVTALALLSENKRLTSLAKHERDNRGEQTKNKRVTHDVLTGMLRTAEARISECENNYRVQGVTLSERIHELEARIAALTELVGDVPLRHSQFCEAMTLNIHCDCGVSSWADRARALLSEPQDGEGGPRTAFSADATPEEVDAWIATRSSAPTPPPASHIRRTAMGVTVGPHVASDEGCLQPKCYGPHLPTPTSPPASKEKVK